MITTKDKDKKSNFVINEDEFNLISMARNGDNSALLSLIEKHSGICVETYKKYINLPTVSGFVSDEIISSKDYIIYNSAKTFDPSMGAKFSTWLANQTRFYCLNCINKYGKLIPVEEEPLKLLIEKNNKADSGLENAKQSEVKSEILEIVKDTLSTLTNSKVKECIERKYFSSEDKCKSYTEIAEEMGVTVQTVINWHKKFIKLVKQKCKNRKILFDFDKN